MPKMKSILALGLIFLLVMSGCQAILPTVQILSQIGIESQVSMPAMVEEATPTVAATEEPAEEPTVEPTATPTEVPTEVPTLAPTATSTEIPTLAPTATTVEEPTPEPTLEPTAEPTVAAETDMSDTAAMTETMAMTETAGMTESMVMTETAVMTDSATMTDSTTMTDSPAMTETTVMTATAPEPEVALPASEMSAVGTATVLVQSLRIRSGPGTTFEVVGGAVQGEQYPITGQAFDCQWYQVDHPQLGLVWIAGGDFAASDVACDTIPAADATTSESGAGAAAAPAEAAATPTPSTLQPTPVPLPAVAPTEAAPAETAPAEETSASDPFPTDKGCMLLQNQLGPELTFTFTGVDSGFTETVTVNSDADVPYCLDPGRYTVTVDAPPPWADINEEFTISAGDRFFFPIRPQ